jgi:hypothetical protein
MAEPFIHSISPSTGPASGGDPCRVTSEGFGAKVELRFGHTTATVLTLREEAGFSIADVRSPLHDEGIVGIGLPNLDEAGLPIPGESATLPDAYRFLRPRRVVSRSSSAWVGRSSRNSSARCSPTPLKVGWKRG